MAKIDNAPRLIQYFSGADGEHISFHHLYEQMLFVIIITGKYQL